MKKIIVNKNDCNQRLDNFLIKIYPNISKVLFIKWIRNKDIKVNNNRCKFNQILNINDEISIYFDHYLNQNSNNKKDSFLNAKNEIDVIYEDNNIIVINKPIGLLSHSDNNTNFDTAINRIKKYLYEKKEWFFNQENYFEPSLANRIDYNTQGLIVAAKNSIALKELNHIFKNKEIEKKYYALIHGSINTNDWNEIKLYLNDSTDFVKTYDLYELNTKIAITKYKKIKTINKYTLIDIKLITGRKHQIRASFNHINHPLVGERKYFNKKYEIDKRYKTQCLISYYLKFKISNSNSLLFYLNKKDIKLNKIWFLD